MKLLVPINNFESAVIQVQAGAKEVYLGGDTELFNSLSFSGRGRYVKENKKICPDIVELKDIVEYCHEHSVNVMYAANIPFLANDIDKTDSYENAYLDYVEKAYRLGVDSIIVGDLGAIRLIRKEGLDCHITASCFFETLTRDQILLLKEIGVNRTVLSYQITFDEIKHLCSFQDMEIEVFGHFGCSFYDDCSLKHNFGECVKGGVGVPCRNLYQFINKEETLTGHYLNSALICSLCSLKKLKDCGVYAVKLVGRDYDIKENVRITEVYRKFMNELEKYDRIDSIEEFKEQVLPSWWNRALCKKHLCKYSDNEITKYFVGVK